MAPAHRARIWLTIWWPVLLLGMMTIGAYGAVQYSFGVFLVPVREATGWSTSALSGGFSLSVLGGGLWGLLAGRGIDRIGARRVLAGSLAVGCVSLLAASFARDLVQFVAAWTLGGAAVAGGLYYHVTMAITARLYPAQRAAAFSVLTLMGALAGPIFYPLAGALFEALDWRVAMRLLVLALFATTLPAALLVRAGPAQPAPAGPTASPTPGPGASGVAELADPAVLRMLGMVGVVSLGVSALTLHQVSAMQATGISIAAAAGIAGTRGFFQFAGRLFLVPLVARLGLAGAIAACYAASAAGTGLLLLAGPIALLFGFIALTGVALGLLSPLHGLYATETYGEARLGTLMATQQVVVSVTGAVGPWIAGIALDATGSYASVLVWSAALTLAGVPFLVRPRGRGAGGGADRAPASREGAPQRAEPGGSYRGRDV